MRLNVIIDRFSLISGLEPEEVSLWTPLCVDAKVYIEGRIKPGVDQEDENVKRRLSNCAAALAFYKYSLCCSQADVESFVAGSMNIRLSQTERQRAKTLWQEEAESAEDLLSLPVSFSFKGVRV